MSSSDNPLVKPSALPFKCPPFDEIKTEHYVPAFETALAEHVKQLESIRACTDAPTFENSVEALEMSGQLLDYVSHVFMDLCAADTNDEMQKIEEEYSVKLAQHTDNIYLDPILFSRVNAVLANAAELTGEQARLLEQTHKDFLHAGAGLDEGKKQELKQINESLAKLSTEFGHKLLAARKTSALILDSEEELAGLTTDELQAAREEAAKLGHEGKYALVLTNTTQQPVFTSLTNRETRRRLFEASLVRAERGDAGDTTAIALEMARLRLRKANLMGKRCYADWALENQMADTASAQQLLRDLLAPCARAAAEEAAALEKYVAEQGGELPLEAWDWAFYAERLRKERYDLDEAELKPYLELQSVLERGVFYTAEQLYGISFQRRTDIPVYHPDVLTYEVFDADGTPLALYLLDPYSRPSKQGGAWMDSFVSQSRKLNQRPVVYNVCNFTKPAEGKPTLLTASHVTTLFHEFGHGLHGMLSDVEYRSLSGTSVPTDFVELPSQVNEHWATHDAVLKNYARHYETHEVIPDSLVAKMKAADTFSCGFETLEVVKAAALDLHWHSISSAEELRAALREVEADAMSFYDAKVPQVPARYHSSYFLHIFGGGYASNYYSYMWAKVLDCDAFEWFTANGGLKRSSGDHFRKTVLSRGGTAEPNALYMAFAGRMPDIKPFLKNRGLLKFVK